MKYPTLFLNLIVTIGLVGLLQLATPQPARADILPSVCQENRQSQECRQAEANYRPVYHPVAPQYDLRLIDLPRVRFLANLAIELAVAVVAVFVLKVRKKWKVLLSVGIVNIISLPVFYWLTQNVFSHSSNSWIFLTVSELFIWLFEAAGIHLINLKNTSRRQALVLSATTNLATILVWYFLIRIP